MHKPHRLKPCAALIATLGACPLNAAVFCPANSADLATALQTAESNGENDQIRLGAGPYEAPDHAGFRIRAERGRRLSISGRWAGFFMPCEVQLFVFPTGISANSSRRGRVLTLDYSEGFDEDIIISDVVLYNGYSEDKQGACLDAVIPAGHGDLVLDRVEVKACEHRGDHGAAVSVRNLGVSTVLIRNSIVSQNTTTGSTIDVAASGRAVFRLYNNTVVGNRFHSRAELPAVRVSSADGAIMSLFNNVIVENGQRLQAELEILGTGISIHHNVLDSMYSGSASVESGTQVVSGGLLFEDMPSNLQPRALSALRDAGADFESQWAGSLDVIRAQRFQNRRLDVGAYEGEALHADGFEAQKPVPDNSPAD